MREDGTKAAEEPSVTTISAARWSRIGRAGSGVAASRAPPRRLAFDTPVRVTRETVRLFGERTGFD